MPTVEERQRDGLTARLVRLAGVCDGASQPTGVRRLVRSGHARCTACAARRCAGCSQRLRGLGSGCQR
eukprot:9367055-Alexandrium_andersonii.AAC.1